MVQKFREEFRLRCVSLEYTDYSLFAQSKVRNYLLLYKKFLFLSCCCFTKRANFVFIQNCVSLQWSEGRGIIPFFFVKLFSEYCLILEVLLEVINYLLKVWFWLLFVLISGKRNVHSRGRCSVCLRTYVILE